MSEEATQSEDIIAEIVPVSRGDDGLQEGVVIGETFNDDDNQSESDSDDEEKGIIIHAGRTTSLRRPAYKSFALKPFQRVSQGGALGKDLSGSTPMKELRKEDEEIRKLRFARHVTAFDIDIEALDEQPWRHPTADLLDYFNYGFNERTWQQYSEKQLRLRAERGQGPIQPVPKPIVAVSAPIATATPLKATLDTTAAHMHLSVPPPPLFVAVGAGDAAPSAISNQASTATVPPKPEFKQPPPPPQQRTSSPPKEPAVSVVEHDNAPSSQIVEREASILPSNISGVTESTSESRSKIDDGEKSRERHGQNRDSRDKSNDRRDRGQGGGSSSSSRRDRDRDDGRRRSPDSRSPPRRHESLRSSGGRRDDDRTGSKRSRDSRSRSRSRESNRRKRERDSGSTRR